MDAVVFEIDKPVEIDRKENLRDHHLYWIGRRTQDVILSFGAHTKELWIDRRENSKSLAWSSVLLALSNVKEVGAVVDRPKALGDIRGVTYIYGMFYRFGLIDVPDDAKCKMNRCRCVSKG